MSDHCRYADLSIKEGVLHVLSHTYSNEKVEKVLKQWQWRYEKNPFITDDYQPFYVYERKGKIVGYTGLTPVCLKVKGKVLFGTSPHDSMTHPAYRGTGIRMIRDLLNKEALIIGVGNVRSEKLWKKIVPNPEIDLGLCYLYLYSLPLNIEKILLKKIKATGVKPLPLLKHLYRLTFDGSPHFTIERIDSFGDDYDDFFNGVSEGYGSIPVRSSAYLNWRFRDCPTEKYETHIVKENGLIKGYVVLKIFYGDDGLKRVRVIETFAAFGDERTYNFIVDSTIKLAIERESDVCQFIICHSDPALIKAIRRKKGWLIKESVQSSVIGKCEGHGIDVSYFEDENNWNITFGDFDQDYL